MKQIRTKARIPLCVLILIAFFLPAYEHYSAYQFIGFIRSWVHKTYDVTTTDAMIAIGTMLMIPLSACLLIVRSVLQKATQRIYVAVPLIFFLFFTGILFVNQSGPGENSAVNSFAPAGPGFYLAGLSCLLLLFTKNKKRKSSKSRRLSKEMSTESVETNV